MNIGLIDNTQILLIELAVKNWKQRRNLKTNDNVSPKNI